MIGREGIEGRRGSDLSGVRRSTRALFTGIIESIGTVDSVRKQGKRLHPDDRYGAGSFRYRVGDSVSVDGVCLTVVGISGSSFSVEATPETLSRSTLKDAAKGSRVNLERALRLTDRLGGHLVQGHVEGTGRIRQRHP